MRNEDDTVVDDVKLKEYKQKFRVLEKWNVIYEEEPEHDPPSDRFYINGQMCWNRKTKTVAIYPCPNGVEMDHYVLHEMLHAAFIAAGRSRNKEELLIQDICKIIIE